MSFGQLVRIIEEFPTGDELALRVTKPGQGLTLEGSAMPDLPESARGIIAGAARTGLELMRDDVVGKQKTSWVLSGSAVLSLRVKSDDEP